MRIYLLWLWTLELDCIRQCKSSWKLIRYFVYKVPSKSVCENMLLKRNLAALNMTRTHGTNFIWNCKKVYGKLNEAGENFRFADEIEYLLDSLDDSNSFSSNPNHFALYLEYSHHYCLRINQITSLKVQYLISACKTFWKLMASRWLIFWEILWILSNYHKNCFHYELVIPLVCVRLQFWFDFRKSTELIYSLEADGKMALVRVKRKDSK